MSVALRYRESQFTPSEAAGVTDLALHLQRDWRSQGFLRAREGTRASFTPRELAEMRLMVKLRTFGLPLSQANAIAKVAAPGVIYAALANHLDRSIAVEGPSDLVSDYLEALENADDDYRSMLAELPALSQLWRHAIIQNGECELVYALEENILDETNEVAGLINLWAVAREIVSTAPRPLFTLVVPKDFRG